MTFFRRGGDFLDEMIEERTKKNPDFPNILEDAVQRLDTTHKLKGISSGIRDAYGVIIREGDKIKVTFSYLNVYAMNNKDAYQEATYIGIVMVTSSGRWLTEDVETGIYRILPVSEHTIYIIEGSE